MLEKALYFMSPLKSIPPSERTLIFFLTELTENAEKTIMPSASGRHLRNNLLPMMVFNALQHQNILKTLYL